MREASTAVLLDLDSTLRNSRQRHHLSPTQKNVPGEPLDPHANWHEYSMAGINDEPMRGPITALRLLWPHHQIHIVSGSNESARGNTTQWLDRHVGLDWIDGIHLRAEDDFTESGPYKVAHILALRRRGIEPVLFFEDWAPAAQYIEAVGEVPVVCVNPCYPCKTCGVDPLVDAHAGQVDNIGGGL
jgi:hypothetical protein